MSETTNRLTIEELDNINKIFDQFDKDNSDGIDKQELKTLSIALNNALSNAELYDFFRNIDENHSGKISREEFIKYASSL